jgi:hypothetical protein
LGFDAQESPPVLTQFSLATILAPHKCYKSSSFDAKSEKEGWMRNDDLVKSYEHRARAVPNTEKYDKIVDEAKTLLNPEEFATLLGHLQEPEEAEIIDRALTLLQEGTLRNDIPMQLVEEFDITLEKARELTREAIKRHSPEKGVPR